MYWTHNLPNNFSQDRSDRFVGPRNFHGTATTWSFLLNTFWYAKNLPWLCWQKLRTWGRMPPGAATVSSKIQLHFVFQQKLIPNSLCGLTKHFPIVTCQKLQEYVRTVADLYFTRSSQASLSKQRLAVRFVRGIFQASQDCSDWTFQDAQ